MWDTKLNTLTQDDNTQDYNLQSVSISNTLHGTIHTIVTSSNLIVTLVFLVSVLICKPSHVSVKYKLTHNSSVSSLMTPLMSCDPPHLRASSHMVPSPKSLEVNPCNLSYWEHGRADLPLHTRSSSAKSQVWHGCNTFWRWVWRQKARPNSQHKSREYFAENNQDPTWMRINHTLIVSWGSKVRT